MLEDMNIIARAEEHNDNLLNDDRKIDFSLYLKNIHETKIISIEGNLREQIASKYVKISSLSEIQEAHEWLKPTGIIPERRYTFEDVIAKAEKNPSEKFSLSDVWAKTSIVHLIKMFNRIPKLPDCIEHLDFSKGLNWEALDTPHYYLTKYKGKWALISCIGGNRATIVVLSNGYDSEIPCRVTYIGNSDLETVVERASLIHHIDCNKRANQVANDRLTSGVQAKDYKFEGYMNTILSCGLYVDESQIKPKVIKEKKMRKCSSWQGFVSVVKHYKFDNAKYAVDKLKKHTDDGKELYTQAIETIACFKMNFEDKIKKLNKSQPVLDNFLTWYFKEALHNQADLKQAGRIAVDTVNLVDKFNKWAKKEFHKTKSIINNLDKAKAFPNDDISIV